MSTLKPLLSALLALGMLLLAPPAHAVDSPGIEAITQFRQGKSEHNVVMNRFFLKSDRFEITPQLGYVPNNPFAQRFVGSVLVGYHISETFGAEAQLGYSPDLGEGDLKGLLKTLVQIAHTGTDAARFQQPLDKVTLSAAFGARWAPLYGKINLIGETVLNFDVYGVAGLAMLSKVNYYAEYDADSQDPGDIVNLLDQGNEVKVGPHLGLGLNFFINQSVALKLDARFSLYVDNAPQYDPDDQVTESRLYSNFVTSAGLAFFFPKMQARVYDY